MKKYLTWHPLGKPGASILRKNYDLVRDFILSMLIFQEMTLTELIVLADRRLAGQIEENIAWHIFVVKLDLEARGIIRSFQKIAPYKSQFLKVNRKATKDLDRYQKTRDVNDLQSSA